MGVRSKMSKDANYIELLKNDEWEVLTNEGFKSFKGIGISKNSNVLRISFDNGMDIIVTQEHEFLSDDFIMAKNAIIGTKLKTSNGIARVVDIQLLSDFRKMYDLLHVEDTHTYITNGITSKNCIFLDEVAFVADYVWDDFFNSVLPTISSGKSSKIIMVSTPKGMNHFYKIYKDAIDNKSNFQGVKIPWWERPDRDEEWKRKTLMEMGGDRIRFAQEYGCQFLGSSNTLIDSEVLERTTYEEPKDFKYGGALVIYQQPIKDQFYILGVDSAKGNGSDYSCIQVLKIVSEHEIEQVAMYRNNLIGTEEFAQLTIGLSKFYNDAYMMVESNDIGELVTNKIWYDYECDRILNCDAKGLGIRATRKTKLAGNLMLKRYMENGWINIVDRRTIYELSRYEEVTPNVFHAAGQNEHDDCVTSLIWGLYYLTTVFYDKDSNGISDVKNIDSKYKIGGDDMPILISDDENYVDNERWEIY